MAKAERYNPSISEVGSIKKGFLLYLFLVPLFLSIVFALMGMRLIPFALNSIAFLLLFVTIVLSRRGFAQERNYNLAKLTKAPKIPYKQLSAYLLGVSVFFSAYIAGSESLVESLFLSGLSIFGYWLYYGFDPRKDKLENFDDISIDLVLETMQKAHSKVALIEKENAMIKDSVLSQKITGALGHAKSILSAIEEEPKKLRDARKFLVVYIDGIADVTTSYRAIEEGKVTPETRERLLRLMDDVEIRFQKELERLKEGHQLDLDLHIDVLREQIKH